MEARVGRVVRAIAGREKDSFFVITGLTDDGCVLLSDGKERLLEKPKRKKLRHVQLTGEHVELEGITNKKLRSVLRTYADARTGQGGHQNVEGRRH